MEAVQVAVMYVLVFSALLGVLFAALIAGIAAVDRTHVPHIQRQSSDIQH